MAVTQSPSVLVKKFNYPNVVEVLTHIKCVFSLKLTHTRTIFANFNKRTGRLHFIQMFVEQKSFIFNLTFFSN